MHQKKRSSVKICQIKYAALPAVATPCEKSEQPNVAFFFVKALELKLQFGSSTTCWLCDSKSTVMAYRDETNKKEVLFQQIMGLTEKYKFNYY